MKIAFLRAPLKHIDPGTETTLLLIIKTIREDF